MLTGSITDTFEVVNSSIANGAGSIGDLSGDGVGSLGDMLTPLIAAVNTASGAGK